MSVVMSHKFLKPPVFLVPIILGTGILFAQDTTYLSLPSASVNQHYHNVDIQVNQDCNGCMCPTGEPMYNTEIISFPDWLDTAYVTFFPDTSVYYYYYGGSYQLVLSGTPMDEDLGSGTILLHEYISFDAWDGYYENATWEFTDVYIIDLEVVEGSFQIGDECIAWNGEAGFYDCEMCCWPSAPDWLGDGYCDYMGGCAWEGPLYNCPELSYDCGDCNADWDGSDPLGFCEDQLCEPSYDVNQDGILNVLDVIQVMNLVLDDGELNCSIDYDNDGTVNILDIVQMVNIILNPLPDDCYLEPDTGECLAAILRFYYDPETGSCETFTWGGCGGVVPFDTMEECEETCE